MAYDGLVIASCIQEFRHSLLGGRIAKVVQPEKDEILLTVHTRQGKQLLQISANPTLPLCCLTEEAKPAPLSAPVFSMALRKQIGNGTILSVRQPDQSLQEDGLERVILFEIEHLDEMGDLGRRFLSVELMGKYSNIILLREDMQILDAIKRIPSSLSSLREVLPGRPYFIPDQSGKKNALSTGEDAFFSALLEHPEPCYAALFHAFSGISPSIASELCFRAGIDPDQPPEHAGGEGLTRLYGEMRKMLRPVKDGTPLEPNILYRGEVPADFSAVPLRSYEGDAEYQAKSYASMSQVIRIFYREKESAARIKQKSADLRKLLGTLLERSSRKLALQEKQLRDTEGKDRFRVYGELLTTYGYSLAGGEDKLVCENYYDGKEITIPLRTDQSALENAKRYFEKYDKLKRTEKAVTVQIAESKRELRHLQSILSALDFAEDERDLREIRREMHDFGFIKKAMPKSYSGKNAGAAPASGKGARPGGKPEKVRAKDRAVPYHFRSTDGYEIYVGKNNYQNEQVSFQIAEGGDLWLHAKNIPGSHVIVKTGGESFDKLPDRLFLEAAALAAWFSSHRADAKVEVDYTLRKNLRKVPDAAPGFVIYHTNYSITVQPMLLPEA